MEHDFIYFIGCNMSALNSRVVLFHELKVSCMIETYILVYLRCALFLFLQNHFKYLFSVPQYNLIKFISL